MDGWQLFESRGGLVIKIITKSGKEIILERGVLVVFGHIFQWYIHQEKKRDQLLGFTHTFFLLSLVLGISVINGSRHSLISGLLHKQNNKSYSLFSFFFFLMTHEWTLCLTAQTQKKKKRFGGLIIRLLYDIINQENKKYWNGRFEWFKILTTATTRKEGEGGEKKGEFVFTLKKKKNPMREKGKPWAKRKEQRS